jgi:cytochrome c oxidase accessory protein FixG
MSTVDSGSSFSWHKLRKKIHLICFLIFVALPFLNLVRFDIPKQRFYFAGYELWINEFGIVFFALMFLMFVVVVSSVFYGRVFCGYLCPQMIFSEASVSLETRLQKFINKRFIRWKPPVRKYVARGLFYAALLVASVFLAFAFISYFVEPRDLFFRLLQFDLVTAGGISGAVVTLFTFLDFVLVRQKFCVTVCPYGYLQGMLGDKHTLLVHYRDEEKHCIECKKCVRVCEMGIDIRDSPFQIECVHCGECIDACEQVMTKLKKPTLIHYTWGETGEILGSRDIPRTWYQRIGIRDAKRIVVLLILVAYACGLTVALAMRRSMLVQISPDRGEKLYRVGDGRVHNKFRYTLANRGGKPSTVIFTIDALPGGTLALPVNPVAVQPGETVNGEFEISVPAADRGELVTHFRILTSTVPGNEKEEVAMTFLRPSGKNAP